MGILTRPRTFVKLYCNVLVTDNFGYIILPNNTLVKSISLFEKIIV